MSNAASANPAALPPALSNPKPSGLWADAWRRFRGSRLAVVMLVVVGLYVLLALLVTFEVVGSDWKEPVSAEAYAPPSWENPLGTDIFKQSVLSKTLYGAKISLTVAFFASMLSIAIGVPMGAMAGYFGGWVDEVIVWLYSTLSSIPWILLILAFAFVLRDVEIQLWFDEPIPLRGMPAVYLALGLTSWVGLCRLIRGEVLKHKNRDYVNAALAFGASKPRIIFRHILPNVTHLIIIDFSLRFVGFIHAEVILSYLGLGPKDVPSWGVMIDDAKQELARGVWWQLTSATAAIFFLSLALNIVGDRMRDALDPKLRE